MPIARFEMPDGRIARFEVPDGTSPEQAQQMIAAQMPKMAKAGDTPKPPDPSEGGSTLEVFNPFGKNLDTGINLGQGATRVLAGVGSGLASVGRAVGLGSVMKSAGLPGTKEEAAVLDAPLMNTTAGKVGNFAGHVAAAAPAMLIPGANTYVGAGLIGAGTGLVTTEGGLADRAKGAAFGAAGGVGGKALGDLVGAGVRRFAEGKARTLAQQQAANATRDATLQSSRQAGYVVTPSQAGSKGMLNSVLEGLGGKIKTQQAASVKNQVVTDNLARKALGLADDAPLSPQTLAGVRQAAGAEYDALRGLGTLATDADFKTALNGLAAQSRNAGRSFPGLVKDNPIDDVVKSLDQPQFDAGDAIDAVRVLRDRADAAYGSGDKALGKSYKGAATALEDMLERAAQASGSGDLVSKFRNARQLIAKTYSVEGALNQGAGTVNAQKLAQQLGRNKPLSGELKDVAKFAQAFPKAAQSGVDVPAYSVLDAAAGAGAVGTGNVPLAALPLLRPVARSAVLSPAYQRAMVNPPSYQQGVLTNAARRLVESQPYGLLSPQLGGLLSIQAAQQ